MMSAAAAPLGAVGRADLLRALAVAPRDRLALDFDELCWFGYVRQPERPARRAAEPALTIPSPAPPAAAGVDAGELPLRMAFVHAIVEREPRQPPEPGGQAGAGPAQVEPIDEASARAPSPRRLIAYQDLVPEARLLPALHRHLGATRAGALDLERLTQQLAAAALPRHLPRRRLRRWHPELVVLLDFCPRLWPYREDMHRLAERLLRHCGRSGVSVRLIDHGPSGPWSDWLAHQNRQARLAPPQRQWVMPSPGAPVLIVSDLGLLLGPQSASCQAWGRFIARLVRAELRPMALTPLGGPQLDATVTRALPVLRWSPDARPRPVRAHGAARAAPAGLDDLLAMVAATRRVDPPLLRALRQLNPRAPLDAGLEGALWCHADVEPGFSVSIRPQAQAAHLRRFGALLPGLQAAVDALRQRHHAHLRAVLNHEERLLWADHAEPALQAASPEAKQQLAAAEHFFRRLAATLSQPGGERAAGRWWDVAEGIIARADPLMASKHAYLLTPLVAARMRWEIARGAVPVAPDWVDPATLSPLLDADQSPVPCWLVRDAASGCLLLQARPAGARQSPLGEALVLDAGGVQVRIGEGAGAHMRWLAAANLPATLARLGEPTPVRIETAQEAITVAPLRRPRGVAAWACDGSGLSVRGASLAGIDARWSGPALRAVPAQEAVSGASAWTPQAEELVHTLQGAELRFAIDADFGVRADLSLLTGQGPVVQRLRWLEPGTFWMGSPAEEPERSEDEGPRHRVTLTRGFWLADTACTQALWQAVMGANPGHFQGDPQRPVESVSWHEVQELLRALERRLPGCAAGLPTEAQWEYACRAGTETPFSFGAQITPEEVNYDGNFPYAGGAKGRDRGETVAVKTLPANAWGLYEMHGNVWEWCADDLRAYDAEARRDPVGPGLEDDKARRAVRGGSWIGVAWGARSAYRNAFRPGSRFGHLGFRLCLRSIEPGQAGGGPGRPAGVSTPARDEPGPARAKRALGLPDWLRRSRRKKD